MCCLCMNVALWDLSFLRNFITQLSIETCNSSEASMKFHIMNKFFSFEFVIRTCVINISSLNKFNFRDNQQPWHPGYAYHGIQLRYLVTWSLHFKEYQTFTPYDIQFTLSLDIHFSRPVAFPFEVQFPLSVTSNPVSTTHYIHFHFG